MEHLHAAATKRSGGLTDFTPDIDGYKVRMERLLHALNNATQLSFFGRFFMQQNIINRLTHRLRIGQLLSQYREDILNQKLNQPIVIVGLPRTGTSLMQQLLSRDSNHTTLYNYEAMIPAMSVEQLEEAKRTHVDPRIPLNQLMVKRSLAISPPTMMAVHEMGTMLPQECIPLMSNSFGPGVDNMMIDHINCATNGNDNGVDDSNYESWIQREDQTPIYNYYKLQLQVIQWQRALVGPSASANRRWILKAPTHLDNLPQILRLFPDALIVWTHRAPAEVVGSQCSLMTHLRSLSHNTSQLYKSSPLLGLQTARAMADSCATAAKTALQSPSSFIHIDYRQLIKSPITVLENIYQRVEQTISTSTNTDITEYLARNAKKRNNFGQHLYSLDQFGIVNHSLIHSIFGSYTRLGFITF